MKSDKHGDEGTKESVNSAKQPFADRLNEWYNAYKVALAAIPDQLSETRNKALQFANDIVALAPIIEKVGYKTLGYTIGIGMPPKIILHFRKINDLTDEDINFILEQNKGKDMLSIIVRAIESANSIQQKMATDKFKLNTIDVELGITPSVNVVFGSKD